LTSPIVAVEWPFYHIMFSWLHIAYLVKQSPVGYSNCINRLEPTGLWFRLQNLAIIYVFLHCLSAYFTRADCLPVTVCLWQVVYSPSLACIRLPAGLVAWCCVLPVEFSAVSCSESHCWRRFRARRKCWLQRSSGKRCELCYVSQDLLTYLTFYFLVYLWVWNLHSILPRVTSLLLMVNCVC